MKLKGRGKAAPLEGRVAAVFTLKQLDGADSHASLLKWLDDAELAEFALRALTDRRRQLDGLDARPFVAALSHESPRVRAQALVRLDVANEAVTDYCRLQPCLDALIVV